MNVQNFVDKHSEHIEQLELAHALAWWNLATTGKAEYEKALQDTKSALRKIYTSRADYEYLLSQKQIADPLLKRQVTLLLHAYKENQISPALIDQTVALETEVEATYTNFRPLLDGVAVSNNELKNILLQNQDSNQRKKAWEASKIIGEKVEKEVLKLVALRNEAAQTAGFSDYYSMRLELQELDQHRLFELLGQLEQATNPHWDRYKPQLDTQLAQRFGIKPSEIMPWHYSDLFFQEAPPQEFSLDGIYKGKDLVEISRAYYRDVGLEADDIIQRSDLYERENKNQHAFCMCLDRKQDVRMLCNMRDNEYWMGTLMHELGHGVYDKYIDQSLPFLLRTYAHTSTTESIAMLFGRLNKSGPFLQNYCGVTPEKAQEIDAATKKYTASNLLVFARWILVMTHFESALYQQPGINLNKLWWDLVEKYQSVHRVPDRDKPDWAAKLHLACAPVYYQNYILGEMTASQLGFYLKKELNSPFEALKTPDVGHFLKTKLFSCGAKYPWEETVQKATGEILNPEYFAQDISLA